MHEKLEKPMVVICFWVNSKNLLKQIFSDRKKSYLVDQPHYEQQIMLIRNHVIIVMHRHLKEN